jgi:hypothetical protein
MKVLIEIYPVQYDSLLRRVTEEAAIYSTLKNAVKVQRSSGGMEQEIMAILCDADDAEMLRQAAQEYCPEVVPQIENKMRLPRFTSFVPFL